MGDKRSWGPGRDVGDAERAMIAECGRAKGAETCGAGGFGWELRAGEIRRRTGIWPAPDPVLSWFEQMDQGGVFHGSVQGWRFYWFVEHSGLHQIAVFGDHPQSSVDIFGWNTLNSDDPDFSHQPAEPFV
jgi:hypothetical protein